MRALCAYIVHMRSGEPLGALRFDEFVLDRDNRTLTHAGATVPVDPKVLDCLELLLCEPGQLIALERMRAALWPGLHVGPGALRKLMTGVRRALAPSGRSHQLIRSRRSLGYEFTGTVSRSGQAPARWPFVGRTRELERLAQACVQPGSSHGALCFVAGEAGAGKSSLLAQLRAQHASSVWLSGQCAVGGEAPAFWPWREVAAQLAHAPRLRLQLRAALARDRGLACLFPELAGKGGVVRAASASAELRFAYCDAFARLLCALSRVQSLAIVLEDLHWADAGSLLVLELLARSAALHPLTIFASYRPQEVAPASCLGELLARTSGRPHVRDVLLGPLSPAELQGLLRAVQHPGSELQHAAKLHELTGGNALFVQQLVQHSLVTDGQLGQALPPGLAHIVAARVALLPEQTRLRLELAAVLGAELDLQLMAAVAEVGVAQLDAELAPAIRAGVLVQEAACLSFAHALLREALHQGTPAHVRQALHRACARLPLVAADAAALANHAFLAGAELEQAERRALCERAGREQLASLAFDRAVLHLGRAVSLLAPDDTSLQAAELVLTWAKACWEADHPSAEVERAFLRACELARRASAAQLFAEAAIGYAIGGDESVSRVRGVMLRPGALGLLQEALIGLEPAVDAALSARVGRCLLLTRAANGDYRGARELAVQLDRAAPHETDPYRHALALAVRWLARDCHDAEDARELVLRLARSTLAPQLQAEACYVALTLSLQAGALDAFEQTIELLEQSVARLTPPLRFGRLGERLSGYFGTPGVARIVVATVRGQLTAAEAGFVQIRAFAEQAGLTGAHSESDYVFLLLLLLRGYRGDCHLLEPIASRLLEPFPAASWQLTLARAQFALSRGERDSALEAFAELRASEFRPVHAGQRLPTKLEALVRLADLCEQLGTDADASSLYDALRPFAGHYATEGGLVSRGAAARSLAVLAMQRGELDAAEQHFQSALALNRSLGHRPEIARTLFGLGQLLERSGRAEGQALLAQAREQAQAIGMKLAAS